MNAFKYPGHLIANGLKFTGACLALFFEATSGTSAQTVTGNPSTDSGWTAGNNTLADGTYVDQKGMYSANMYTTAFDLGASSNLVSTGTDPWNPGDLIVGVGGVFANTTATAGGWSAYSAGAVAVNSNLTYDGVEPTEANGSTSTRIVVKYAASAAPSAWSTSSVAPANGNGVGSLAGGGVGSVLLGTNPYVFSPSNSGVLVDPSDSPEIQTSSGAVVLTDGGDIGRVITYWSGSALVGFESFLDITLLDTEYPSLTESTPPGVMLGNAFDLDLQRDSNSTEITDAEGVLPASVPEPASFCLIGVASGALLLRRPRRV